MGHGNSLTDHKKGMIDAFEKDGHSQREIAKEINCTIFKVFGMTQPGIESRFLGPLANTLPTRPMSRYWYNCNPKKMEHYSDTYVRAIHLENKAIFTPICN